MKYALFEFVNDKSCEIGETRWILREDATTFNKDAWDFRKEIMVSWPRDFKKIHRKILKDSIDPTSISTTTYVARVLHFSDDYDDSRQHMMMYLESGSVETPNHGRGKRASRPNTKYLESEDEDVDIERPAKKQKKPNRSTECPSESELEALRKKYRLNLNQMVVKSNTMVIGQEDKNTSESEDEMTELEEITSLKKENHTMRLKLKEKEKEIKNLMLVISNFKAIPSLQDLVKDLGDQVQILKAEKQDKAYMADGPRTPSSSTASGASTPRSSDSECDTEMLCPGVLLTKGQYKSLVMKTDVKDFVYVIMGMLWSREILMTHSVTGKCSNAFKEREAKPQLDPVKVEGICEYAAKRFGCKSSEVQKIMSNRINNVVKVEKAKKNKSDGK